MAPEIAILMGSDSDFPILKKTCEVLDEFGVSYEVRVLSAHRTPDHVQEYVKKSDQEGTQVYIAAAGGAAHLPGVIASFTIKPVLGIPIKMDEHLAGLDALLSILQMPGGVPVGTLGVGAPGAKNAGLLAVSILALKNEKYAKALKKYRETMVVQVLEKDRKIREQTGKKST